MADLANIEPDRRSRLAAIAARPQTLAAAAIAGLSILAWLYLALATSRLGDPFAVLCQPLRGATNTETVLLAAAMWIAMVFAMMLPSAAPMVMTYADIAEAAARKHEPIVSPFVLVAGYSVVWLGFAVFAALAQAGLSTVALPSFAPPLLSGAALVAAGAYQFSPLKHACLRQCRQPFPFFFTNWQTTPRGVFRLGLEQGRFCVGCCWAAMAMMLVVGAMNVLWMALLGALMTAEKMTRGLWLTRLLGVGFIAFGLYLAIGAGVRLG